MKKLFLFGKTFCFYLPYSTFLLLCGMVFLGAKEHSPTLGEKFETMDSVDLEEFQTEPSLSTSTNQSLEDELQLPDPVITNYTSVEIERALKGLGENESNAYNEFDEGSTFPEVREELPAIQKPIEGWGYLKLGQSLEEVRSVLSNQYPWMVIRPLEDGLSSNRVYFLESYKNDFFTRVQFQFNVDQDLYLLRLEMNPRYFSFPKIYNRLFNLYGPPQENSYIRVTWKDETRSLQLYRNHTVIYLDKKNWEENLAKSVIEDQRQKLLNSVLDDL